ncbi:hypothetical protein GCK72_001146 [Caenorhabditis remanei]|nr:hypothetical protein GCK72_001146 [Caenorhabditis remanei]KAF1769329.1 hypothetical protein GCK72_001146 [Caenorhabditis remanei]
MDVSQLTDAELRESLKSHGVSVGPIVASTRKLYEKKLLKFTGKANDESLNVVDLNDSQINEEVHQEEKRLSPVFQRKTPSSAIKTPVREAIVRRSSSSRAPESDTDDDCEESMRILTEEEMAADRLAARQSSQGIENRGSMLRSSITYTIIFVIIAVFFYFLFENVEQLQLATMPSSSNADDTV